MVIAALGIDATLHTARRSCVDFQREGMDMGRVPDHTLEETFQGEASKVPGRAARYAHALHCDSLCPDARVTPAWIRLSCSACITPVLQYHSKPDVLSNAILVSKGCFKQLSAS